MQARVPMLVFQAVMLVLIFYCGLCLVDEEDINLRLEGFI